MSKLLYHGNGLNTTSGDADFVNYDNTDSGLSATNVQSALDEITEDKISILSLTTAEYEAKKSEYDAMNVLIRLTDSNRTLNASNISYDDSSTSLGASDVQTAIEAVSGNLTSLLTDVNIGTLSDTVNTETFDIPTAYQGKIIISWYIKSQYSYYYANSTSLLYIYTNAKRTTLTLGKETAASFGGSELHVVFLN